jgi:hypothetical protein
VTLLFPRPAGAFAFYSLSFSSITKETFCCITFLSFQLVLVCRELILHIESLSEMTLQHFLALDQCDLLLSRVAVKAMNTNRYHTRGEILSPICLNK